MNRTLFSRLTTCLLLCACADDGGGGEGLTETGDGDPGDGDGDPGDGDGDPGDGDGDPGDGDGDPGDGDGDTGDGDGDTGDGDGDPNPNNCAQLFNVCAQIVAAFDAETLAIRSCSKDDDCGQALQGTSCGCTQDWVARSDADTTCFYDLIDQAAALQCELPLVSDCSCPPADGFICDAGICNWNYL